MIGYIIQEVNVCKSCKGLLPGNCLGWPGLCECPCDMKIKACFLIFVSSVPECVYGGSRGQGGVGCGGPDEARVGDFALCWLSEQVSPRCSSA